MAVDDGYTLARTDAEAKRLDRHNQPLINIAGFVIHPEIRKTLPTTGAVVADLATGSAAFLRNLSEELPEDAQIHGFDISPAAFPDPSELPKNISLDVLDAKKPLPSELHGKYDVIFLRLLNIAMTPEDWEKVAHTAFSMLKPGGSLQWYEGQFRDCRFPLQAVQSSQTAALREGFGMWFDDWLELDFAFDNLDRILHDIGFHGIERTAKSTDREPETRFENSALWIGAMRSGLLMRIKAGLKPAPPDEASLNDLIARCLKEVETGTYIRFNTHIWVATKPRRA